MQGNTSLQHVSQNWTDERWEIVEQRDENHDFIPMQIEVYKEAESLKSEGLLDKPFDTPIQYATGARSHRSVAEVIDEQNQILSEEQEVSSKISISQEELDQMIEQAYLKGKQEAEQEESRKYQEKIGKIEQNLTTIIRDLAKQEKEVAEDLEKSALELALQISKKIIEEAVEINPEYILQVLNEALRLSGGARIKKVKVSPQDLEFIEIFKIAESIKEYDGSWEFEADETIKAGCVLESSAGIIDFQLDQSWARIKDKVLALKK